MRGAFASDVTTLLIVAGFALIANASALVWGPNMVYLMQRTRPLARSVAYTIGRGLTLTIASALIVSSLLSTGRTVDQLADEVKGAANAPHPAIDVLIGLAIVGVAFYVWKNPPSFLRKKQPDLGDSDTGRVWPALLLGVTILFANLLEFVWQVLGVGGAVASTHRNSVVTGLAVVLWTVFGTATLWVPAIAHVVAPRWANERFERLTARIPAVKPWEVALPIGLVGVLFAVFGVWKAIR